MSVTQHTPISPFTGDGATDTVAFDWPVLSASDMRVKVNGADLTLNVGFTVDIVARTVTFAVAPAAGAACVLYRSSVLSRDTDYQTAGDFRATVVNRDIDRIWLVFNEIMNGSRASLAGLRVPAGEVVAELPVRSARAGKALAFDSVTGEPTVLAPADGSAVDVLLQLANSTIDTQGAALVAFSLARNYAAGTLGAAVKAGVINVKLPPYSAAGDGVTDDTAAMAAAHATGKLVYYPAGDYKFSRLAVSIASGGIIGDGQTQTILKPTNVGSEDIITFAGGGTGGPAGAVICRDFQIQGVFSGGGTPAKTGGAAISVSPAVGAQNNYSRFYNVTVYGIPIGIDFVRSEMAVVRDCDFLACPEAGLKIANRYNIDGGDMVVTGCTFSNPYTYGAGVKYINSGGLRFTDNKILGGAQGFLMAYEAVAGDVGPAQTAILIIANCSIENQANQNISLTRVSGSNKWFYMLIHDNELAGCPVGIATDTSGFIQQLIVHDNTIQLAGSGTPLGIALDGVSELQVHDNTIKANGGTTPIGLYLANCAQAKIGINQYDGFAVGNARQIVTPGANVSVHDDMQTGTAASATSGWAAYGALYRSPLITVTFPTAFKNTPAVRDVSIMPNALNGELGAVVNTVSATTLTFYVISAVTGIAASANWQCRGIL